MLYRIAPHTLHSKTLVFNGHRFPLANYSKSQRILQCTFQQATLLQQPTSMVLRVTKFYDELVLVSTVFDVVASLSPDYKPCISLKYWQLMHRFHNTGGE